MNTRVRGGKKAAKTIEDKLGKEAARKWRQEIGRIGGLKSRGGGFTNNPELARRASQKSWQNRKGEDYGQEQD